MAETSQDRDDRKGGDGNGTGTGTDAGPVAKGVDRLIDRLRDQGVEAGKQEAEKLVADARQRAEGIVADAEERAREIVEHARQQAQRDTQAAHDAMTTAARDTLLTLKRTLSERFAGEIARLVSDQMKDAAFLRKMILTVLARARDELDLGDGEKLEIVLPKDVIGLEELRRNPDEMSQGPITRFVEGVTGDFLREGVTLKEAEAEHQGISVRLTERDIELELTDRAVASVLREHLQPRFRALLEGIVK